ncbi:hypothetical protein [Chitinophaga pinensis]|uniref:hypothetical protein n=1 Tax=Chitinophaga pinensis TaxID=79329 RepID=UPI001C99C572|nr:hypothetical protein [Chitinophaga pinensis]
MQYIGLLPRIKNDFLKKESREFNLRKEALQKIIATDTCPDCNGKRLNETILSCKIKGMDIADCSALPVDELLEFINSLSSGPFDVIIKELQKKLAHLITIGLQYLTLDRTTNTLSGGESQRIKMVRHLGNSIEDLLYIFDEPSIGLHAKDLDNISKIIRKIKEKGNSVLIVEHDPDIIKIADHVIDVGPLSGVHGGEIIYEGTFEGLCASKGKTGEYFSQERRYKGNPLRSQTVISIKNADLFNLKNITVDIPMNVLTVVTGVAGSGKSTLIGKVLPLQLSEVKIINQSPIAGSQRSTLLTYLGISDRLRKLFASANHVSDRLFSTNSLGACPNCKGLGVEKIDLAFMDDIEQPCDVCHGTGFDPQVLKYQFLHKNIAEVMDLTVEEALSFLSNMILLRILNCLQILVSVT